MNAADTLATLATDPWMVAGLVIGTAVLAAAIWLLRDERRRQATDLADALRHPCWTPRHIVPMGVDDSGQAWYAPHCKTCAGDGPLFAAAYTSEAWEALRAWDHHCQKVSA